MFLTVEQQQWDLPSPRVRPRACRRPALPGALAGGRADSAILQEFMPRYANKDYTRQGRLANMIKDLKFAQDLSLSTNTSMPITAACMEIYKMLTAAGLGEEDLPVLMEYFKGPDRNVVNAN